MLPLTRTSRMYDHPSSKTLLLLVHLLDTCPRPPGWARTHAAVCQKTVVISRQRDCVVVPLCRAHLAQWCWAILSETQSFHCASMVPTYDLSSRQRSALWGPSHASSFSIKRSRAAHDGNCSCSWLIMLLLSGISKQLPADTPDGWVLTLTAKADAPPHWMLSGSLGLGQDPDNYF